MRCCRQGEERRRFEGALVPVKGCFGAGSFGGGRELDNSDKGQGFFCAVGFSACWLVGDFSG